MALSRRRFIGLTGGLAGSAALAVSCSQSAGRDAAAPDPTATTVPTPLPTATRTPVSVATDQPVLVVVQMGGGNDGLNTLVPLESGVYRDARPTVAIAAEDTLALTGLSEYGLHPSLAPLVPLWDQGRLAAMQAIGIPDQSRSHFVALDTWWAGQTGAPGSTGWLGRWLDATAAADANPLRAIALGGGSPALMGDVSRPVVVQSLTGFDFQGPAGGSDAAEQAFTAMASPPAGGLRSVAQAAIPVAIESVDALQTALTSTAAANEFDETPPVAQFEAAADIIAADLGTQVIVVNLGGFDTHANQLAAHRTLLATVGEGVAALFDRLETTGHAGRTMLMAYSEFGRRVGQNGSGGTDHGQGGLAFLTGPGLAGSAVVGDADFANLEQGDLPISVDARSLYTNALTWLGGPTSDVLGGEWDTYDLLA